MTSTTVDALKALYAALGGTSADVADLTLIPDIINAIASLGSIKAASAMSVDNSGNTTISSAGKIVIAPSSFFEIDDGNNVIKSTAGGGINIISDDGFSVRANADSIIRVNNGSFAIAADDAFDINSYSSDVTITADGAFNVTACDESTIKSTSQINIESLNDIVNIQAHDDVEIESQNSGISITAGGGSVALGGDTITANGDEVAVVTT